MPKLTTAAGESSAMYIEHIKKQLVKIQILIHFYSDKMETF